MAKLKEMIDVAGDIQSAEKMARQLVKEKGEEYLLDLQTLLSAQGKINEAKETCEKLLSGNSENTRALYNSGWFYAIEGKLREAFIRLNAGRSIEAWGNPSIGSIRKTWMGQDISEKTVLMNMEAGLGDQIIFVRFAKNLAQLGAKVVISCNPSLAPLFARIPEIGACMQPEAAPGMYHDYVLPSMLSPVPLQIEYQDLNGFPYLYANPEYVEKFSDIISDNKKTKIGIRWLGRAGDDYINRLFDPNLLFDTVNKENTSIYSLQKDLEDKSIIPEWVYDLDPLLENWEDTAGAIENLDLIITSCTGVAHMAAAMGKPTWVIVPIMPYFIWALPGDTSPWYDSVKLYRQTTFGTWDDVFEKINRDLEEYLD